MSKIKAPPVTQPHPEDDCQGCQAERKQNNMLVQFYERLDSMEKKMGSIKTTISNQSQVDESHKHQLSNMDHKLREKPEQTIKLIEQHNSKEMGYELASALIEREIKNKLENERLQKVIEQLQKEKAELEEQNKKPQSESEPSTFFRSKSRSFEERPQPVHQSRYSDSIDEIRQTDESAYFSPKKSEKKKANSYFREKNSNSSYWQDTTSFSAFTSPSASARPKNESSQQNSQYDGLNLWLYQFKPEQIDVNPIKALRKPPIRQGKGKN